MTNGGADGLKLEHALFHCVFLEHETHAGDAVGAEDVRLLLHAGDSELPRIEHRLREHRELLTHAPLLPLEPDVVDGGAHHQAEGAEASLFDEEEFIDRKIAREKGGTLAGAAHPS